MKVAAGVVLYNPEIERLEKNIKSVATQVDEIIFFDNGSRNINQILNYLKEENLNYQILTSSENLGIAHALNQICEVAYKKGYNWILTLDQDTVISKNLILKYSKYLDLPDVGQLSCVYKDRNAEELKDKINAEVIEVKECITSGALLNLRALFEVGGFDEKLFIDYVDFDLCYALDQKGYKTYRISYVGMLHEIGHITSVRFFNRKLELFNHNAFRHYYRCRNFIIFSRRYNLLKNREAVYIQFKAWIRVLLYENKKIDKTRAMFKGIHDGLKSSVVRENWLRK